MGSSRGDLRCQKLLPLACGKAAQNSGKGLPFSWPVHRYSDSYCKRPRGEGRGRDRDLKRGGEANGREIEKGWNDRETLIWYPLEPESGPVRGGTGTDQSLNGHLNGHRWHMKWAPLAPEWAPLAPKWALLAHEMGPFGNLIWALLAPEWGNLWKPKMGPLLEPYVASYGAKHHIL